MDTQDFAELKEDIWEVFEEDAFTAAYRELDLSGSTVDEDFGIIKSEDVSDVVLQATYVLPPAVKEFDKDVGEFRPRVGGRVYFATLQLENECVTLRPQLGTIVIQGVEYQIQYVRPLPPLYDSSIVTKCGVSLRDPSEGTQ